MSIDWDIGPEGAIGYAAGDYSWCKSIWYKRINGALFYTNVGEPEHWRVSRCVPENVVWKDPVPDIEWSGLGIPPEGTICEIETVSNVWAKVIVVAVTDHRVYCEDFGVIEPGEYSPIKKYARFRPIRTPEQIAAEKRIEEINEMAELSLYGHYAFTLAQAKIACAVLHDNGYRKVTP